MAKPGPEPVIYDDKAIRAFELKMEGKTYQEISDEIGLSVPTVTLYFSKKGKWCEPYKLYVFDQKQSTLEKYRYQLRQHLPAAVLTLVELLDSKNDFARLGAAKEIIAQATAVDPNQAPKVAVQVNNLIQEKKEAYGIGAIPASDRK